MACRFIDSFDHYVTADLAAKYTALTGAPTINAAAARYGAAGLRMGVGGAGTLAVTKTLDNQATWIVGFGFRIASLPSTTTALMQFLDAGTLQCDLRLVTDGTLQVTRNGTVLGTSVTALTAASFHQIDMLLTIHPTAGVVTVKLDGATVITLTTQNTRNTANSTANGIKLLNVGVSINCDFDDLYIFDGTGAANNTFPAQSPRVQYVAINAAGNYPAVWAHTGGASNYQSVNETPPDGDTTYISSANPTDKFSGTLAGTVAGTQSVYAVQAVIDARMDDAGPRSIAPLIRNHSTDSQGTTQNLTSSYLFYTQQYDTNPSNGNAAWAVADLTGELGVVEVV